MCALEIYLPFAEEEFLQESVNFAGEHWRQKFFSVKERVRDWHIMPLELAPTPEGEDPFARVNLWMLNHAVVYGAQNIRFICLWDGKAGDGPGDKTFARCGSPRFRPGLCARHNKLW